MWSGAVVILVLMVMDGGWWTMGDGWWMMDESTEDELTQPPSEPNDLGGWISECWGGGLGREIHSALGGVMGHDLGNLTTKLTTYLRPQTTTVAQRLTCICSRGEYVHRLAPSTIKISHREAPLH